MSLESLGIKKFSDRAISYAPEFDENAFKKVIPTGISYIDKMIYGIQPDDFVIVGAKTGAGKSELANAIAMNAGADGRRVIPMALEATEGEWEMRAKFRLYMSFLIRDHGPIFAARFTFLDFKLGLLREHIRPYRSQVEEMVKALDTVSVFYRGKDFGIKEFTRIFNAVNDKADLVVIDHLHYFDTDDDNENRAFSEIMKKIRDLNQITGIPVLMVGHLRKKNKISDPLVPDEDSFHGTSNIGKIATVLITLSPGDQFDDNRFGTYFRIAKCRGEGRVTRYVGLGTFNTLTNSYEKEFVLGKLKSGDREFEAIPTVNHPLWYQERK